MVFNLENTDPTKVLLNRIMLIEEDPAAVEELKKLLSDNGFQVSVARDGGQAQGTIRMHPPDLILMQVILPGESGFEICEKVKENYPRIPILIYTGVSLESAVNLGERVGADGYLIKPATPEKLFEVMQNVAEAVWAQAQEEDAGDAPEDGYIKFRCRCGQRFKEKYENRGRYTTCSNCQSRTRIPNKSFHQFYRDETFVGDDSSSGGLQPLKFVTVKCPGCQTFYKLANVQGDWRKCPRCSHVHTGSLSIVGAPMSRAALESSLRVLRILNGKSKGKKLMLPEREIVFGKDEGCDIRHKSKSVSGRHCSLKPTEEGIHVRDLGSERGTFIDNQRVSGQGLVKAGSVLQIGDLKFRLVGEDLSVEEELQRVQKWSEKEQMARQRGIRMIEAGKETAAEAAQVIQQYWNIMRKRAIGEDIPEAVTAADS
ncbi:MAG: response regulator [Planctomycetota bacterium]|nr:response regulator [Planctomycetota bacterium]MDA1165389.1 response regulator [Planctomycetota bacterium]